MGEIWVRPILNLLDCGIRKLTVGPSIAQDLLWELYRGRYGISIAQDLYRVPYSVT